MRLLRAIATATPLVVGAIALVLLLSAGGILHADTAVYTAKSLGRDQTYVRAEPDEDASVPSARISPVILDEAGGCTPAAGSARRTRRPRALPTG